MLDARRGHARQAALASGRRALGDLRDKENTHMQRATSARCVWPPTHLETTATASHARARGKKHTRDERESSLTRTQSTPDEARQHNVHTVRRTHSRRTSARTAEPETEAETRAAPRSMARACARMMWQIIVVP